ncbi:MAG: hypothetical protein QGH25_20775, partial [Candidatus Latescibacteria bacterium]|nr:hypothetical protein [Candidatus Latescibacterota bacterium]
MTLLAATAFWHVPELPRQIDDRPALRDAERMRTDPWIFYAGVDHRSGRPAGHLARHAIYLLCGPSQRGFHLFSIALHVAIAFLVACLAFRWNAAAPRLAGALFLLNVAHFKAVHHIAALEYLLATGFSVGAYLLLWAKEDLLARPSRLALLYLCIIGATASHIASWGMWPVFAWVMWQRGYRWQTALQLALPLLIINATFSVHVLAQMQTDDYTTTSRALGFLASGEVWSLTALRMFAWFVAYLFLFAHAAPWPMWEAPLWQIGIGTTLIVVALWQVYAGRRSPIRDCALWIACTLVPFALQSEETIRHVPGPSRYFYLGTVASSILIAEAVALARHLRGGAIWRGIAFCLCLVSSIFYLRKVEALSWYTGSIIARSEGDFARA